MKLENYVSKSNSFGSFSGEFKIPGNGLTGVFDNRLDEDDEGSRFWDDDQF